MKSVRLRKAVSLALSLASFKYEKKENFDDMCMYLSFLSLSLSLFVCLLLLVLSVIFNTYNKKGREKTLSVVIQS